VTYLKNFNGRNNLSHTSGNVVSSVFWTASFFSALIDQTSQNVLIFDQISHFFLENLLLDRSRRVLETDFLRKTEKVSLEGWIFGVNPFFGLFDQGFVDFRLFQTVLMVGVDFFFLDVRQWDTLYVNIKCLNWIFLYFLYTGWSKCYITYD